MSAEQSPDAPSVDYQRGWDDCLERVFKVLGEKFPRRAESLLKPATTAVAPDISTPQGRQRAADNAKWYRENLKPFA